MPPTLDAIIFYEKMKGGRNSSFKVDYPPFYPEKKIR